MSVGLAIIAKNEQERLPTLLESVEGAFDRVVLVDTGSTDRTKQIFTRWAEKQDGLSFEVRYFHWIKDFGAARKFAQSLLDTDWEVWADCDDSIIGAKNIRGAIAQAPDQIAGFVCGYNYAQHPQTGQSICYLKRERIVRRGAGEWTNRVHEAQVLSGPVMQLGKDVVEWVHNKQHMSVEEMQKFDADRNLDILKSWVEDEPHNTRVLAYLGTETSAKGDHADATRWFEEYLRHDPEWDEERAQVHRKLSTCLLLQEQYDAAIDSAMAALKVMPQWTDSYLTLGEAYFAKQEFAKSLEWGLEALRRGEPDTMLIINPFDYTYQARKIIAGAYAGLKNWDEAVKYGNEAWQLNPADDGLAQALQVWRTMAKKEHTANTIAMLAQALVAHDEQWKALILLEQCIPHFALDHPGIVNLRSELRDRLEWVKDPRSLLTHYAEGGSKPEDFLPDDKIDEVASSLPRTIFLYKGIHEQMLEMHHEGLMDDAVELQLPQVAEVLRAGAA